MDVEKRIKILEYIVGELIKNARSELYNADNYAQDSSDFEAILQATPIVRKVIRRSKMDALEELINNIDHYSETNSIESLTVRIKARTTNIAKDFLTTLSIRNID